MKKLVIGFVVLAVLAVALSSTGIAYAQQGGGNSRGTGQGMRGGMRGSGLQGTQSGILHDDLIAFYAQEFGLTVDELNTRLASGETMSAIAISEGYEIEDFFALMTDARAEAIAQAVADGDLTQEQADWMLLRGQRSGGNGRGAGQGLYLNPDCPYAAQTTP